MFGMGKRLCWFGVAAALGAPMWAAESADSMTLKEAVRSSDVKLSLRYRFEAVEDDGVERDASASTLRTALMLSTQEWRGLRLVLEAENVTVVGDSDGFRNAGAGSRSNGVTDRATVADVAQTELNQAFVEWRRGEWTGRLGRLEINEADQRFIGAVGWRQNHQSFDALSVQHKLNERVELGYHYLDKVHRIFGDSRDLGGHYLKGKFDLGAAAGLRLYVLELDFDDFPALSTRTVGAEIAGSHAFAEDRKLLYEGEIAQQSDTGDNPSDVDAGYYHLMVGGAVGAWTVRAGLEVLEGSPEDGRFATPLATLHKFNGWADKFLTTPSAGLEDLYLSLGHKRGSWNLVAAYHQFEAESASAEYGSEVDLQVSWKSDWGQTFALKLADYSADDFSTDTTKWMVWTAYTF